MKFVYSTARSSGGCVSRRNRDSTTARQYADGARAHKRTRFGRRPGGRGLVAKLPHTRRASGPKRFVWTEQSPTDDAARWLPHFVAGHIRWEGGVAGEDGCGDDDDDDVVMLRCLPPPISVGRVRFAAYYLAVLCVAAHNILAQYARADDDVLACGYGCDGWHRVTEPYIIPGTGAHKS